MSEDRRDNAVFAFLGLFAAAFAAQGAATFQQEGMSTWCIVEFAIAAGLMAAGIMWSRVRSYLGPQFAQTAARVVSDFKWWTLLLMLLFAYFGMPRILRSVDLAPERGDPMQNKYVCRRGIQPINNKHSSALVIEFGVRTFETNGFHTQITLASPWSEYGIWYAAPRRLGVPQISRTVFHETAEQRKAAMDAAHEKGKTAGVNESIIGQVSGCVFDRRFSLMRICRADPTVLDISVSLPSITPRLSYYVYIAGERTDATKVTYFDDMFAMDDPDRLDAGEMQYGRCPE